MGKENKKGSKYTKQELIGELQRFYKEFGKIPIASNFENLKDYPSRKTFTNYFGNFNDAIREAGLTPSGISFKDCEIRYTEEFWMNSINEYMLQYKSTPIMKDFNNFIGFEVKNYIKNVFGSWNNFLNKCNLPINQVAQHDDYFLESEFHRFVRENKRIPKFRDFNNSDYPSFWCYQSRFGSWNNAVKFYGYQTMEDVYNNENIKEYLKELCNKILTEENRKVITVRDIDNFGDKYTYSTCLKHLKKEKLTVRKYLNSLGFEMLNEGSGMNYIFENGEKVLSYYEYQFSNYLRDKGLLYNKDYFKEIKYNNFIPSYKGLMKCDYKIRYNNRTIYIEIAGILKNYKDKYCNNIQINSKSREKYRLALLNKENMLKQNNLEYYIIFPQDCNEGFFNEIFNKEGEMVG